ncbi:MAG: biotin transporter BioY [SAR324 cluster bacterium]|jgi:biotin transport system substrate-specific component|uniref:Biotin transporter n=1 Tax=SAR324 cluster bacterium TaxID=2024889 RepID=A0A432GKC3_9DELT|nr:MAG: biotin transporter BioY [SAR324 cluster bacterium]HBD29527.1 biotin transporter BioY [Deltaproteobacteria bacterium]HIN00225.1 biotin transporter BioY [Deltaproteobacteria bacterium]|tara:strand:+ start:303 stop:911 length:609 start_codon:yes stop_codon:yes gene_type:complete
MKTQSQVLHYPSLTEALVLGSSGSSTQRTIRYGLLALAGSVLIAICAQISVPLFPVPMTLQTFAVFLIGLTYGWRLGAVTIALYLAEGAFGLPVFAGGKGGLIEFISPTAGFKFGFLLAATACGWFAERGFDRSYTKLFAALLVGNILLYAPGLLWLGSLIGWDKPVLEYGLYPFILGDLLKIAMAVLLLPSAWKYVNRLKQ